MIYSRSNIKRKLLLTKVFLASEKTFSARSCVCVCVWGSGGMECVKVSAESIPISRVGLLLDLDLSLALY